MTPKKKAGKFTRLKRFIKNNGEESLRTHDLKNPAENPEFNWKGLKKKDEELIQQLRSYQRLLRVVPPGHTDLIFNLLDEGLQSAIEIAAIPSAEFLTAYASLHKDPEILKACHRKAVAIRTQLLLRYVDQSLRAEAKLA